MASGMRRSPIQVRTVVRETGDCVEIVGHGIMGIGVEEMRIHAKRHFGFGFRSVCETGTGINFSNLALGILVTTNNNAVVVLEVVRQIGDGTHFRPRTLTIKEVLAFGSIGKRTFQKTGCNRLEVGTSNKHFIQIKLLTAARWSIAIIQRRRRSGKQFGWRRVAVVGQ